MNNRVKVKVVNYEDVSIPIEDVKKLTISLLEDIYDWKSDYFISADEEVVQEREYNGSHITTVNEIVRKVKKEDKFLQQLFRDIQSYKG